MKDSQIIEIAIKHIFQPHIYNSRRICSEYNITPIKFHKLQTTEAWQLVETQHQQLKESQPEEKIELWKEEHYNKIEDWNEQKYQLARYQMHLGVKIGRLLMRGVTALENIQDDFELLDQMKDYRQVIGEYSKAYSSVSGQSASLIAEALAVEPLLELLQQQLDAKDQPQGEQQDLFTQPSNNN